jgi:hypothetical protein
MLLTRIAWAAAEQRKAQQRDSNMAAYRSRIAMVGGGLLQGQGSGANTTPSPFTRMVC